MDKITQLCSICFRTNAFMRRPSAEGRFICKLHTGLFGVKPLKLQWQVVTGQCLFHFIVLFGARSALLSGSINIYFRMSPKSFENASHWRCKSYILIVALWYFCEHFKCQIKMDTLVWFLNYGYLISRIIPHGRVLQLSRRTKKKFNFCNNE